MGYRIAGVEIERKRLWGGLKNIQGLKESDKTHIIHGDALNICIKKGIVSAIITDPPYGTAATTKGYSVAKLLLQFFKQISLILEAGNRIVIAIPSTIEIEDIASEILNARYYRFFQYVHRSLTRKILVFVILENKMMKD